MSISAGKKTNKKTQNKNQRQSSEKTTIRPNDIQHVEKN